jgi:hypothetical protein
MVVLHAHEATLSAWETKALRIRIEGMETSLVLAKTEYVLIVNYLDIGLFFEGPSRVKHKCQVTNAV